ncbi:hypothetical protein PEC730217_42440 [Pectobacterium carotovorum subsp. carotovorum]|uniref:hypothetical protein n=1 Tax=Pectobacterium versatile TaxID=2488639 RepID=UPI001F318536|nr:hypothetical protein [Pectobacterium versatile]GKW35464.1 hypothetical protein PEC730217_42440 [Pectobacterium carotovorum subsp. carotovorum]
MEKESNERLKNECVPEDINKKRRSLIKRIAPMTQIKDALDVIARSVFAYGENNLNR